MRPEFVRFASSGIPVDIAQVSDAGRHRVVDARHGEHRINMLIGEDDAIPADSAHVDFEVSQTRLYADGWVVE